MADIVIAFDLYGTLLSTESIAKKLSEHFGKEKAQSLAALWRSYQLEYTWRLNSMSMTSGTEHLVPITANRSRPVRAFFIHNPKFSIPCA